MFGYVYVVIKVMDVKFENLLFKGYLKEVEMYCFLDKDDELKYLSV